MVVLKRMLPQSEKGSVGGNHDRTFVAVPGRDLVQEVGSLLIERQIPEFVTDQQSGLDVGFELAHRSLIYLGSEQVIEHVHVGVEQDG